MDENKIYFSTSFISKNGGQKINEDYFGFVEKDDIYCWVLADGLGGHGDGEIASTTAVEEVVSKFLEKPECNEEAVKQYINFANRAVYEKKHIEKLNSKMMTTIVVVLADREKIIIGNIGDSRAYVLQNKKKLFITKDHSVPYILYETGEIRESEIRNHEDSNRLTKALGTTNHIEASVNTLNITDTNLILLCSDGFWRSVSELEVEKELKSKGNKNSEWLKKIEEKYFQNITDKTDNYTACIIQLSNQSEKKRSFMAFYMWLVFITAMLIGAIIGSKILFIK